MTTYTVSFRLVAAAVALSAIPAFAGRPEGDSTVFAAVPAPGFPEGIAVRGESAFVLGPAAFGFTVPPTVVEYNTATGAIVHQYPITFSNPFVGLRGGSCIAFGPDGRLYAIEPFVGIIRMELNAANDQSIYATFPPSQNTLLNDLAFDERGNLYVTDSFQATIFKVPAGGGAAQVWFQDARLAGNPAFPFGVNGIRVDKQAKKVYVSVTVRNDFSGAIYRLPLVDAPAAADLEEFHVFASTPESPLPGPDGIAFAKDGKLYVALAGSSQISVLLANGQEQQLMSGPAKVPGTADTKPWANPANIAFDDAFGRILVTNHASLVQPTDPSLFFVFDVAVNAKGMELP